MKSRNYMEVVKMGEKVTTRPVIADVKGYGIGYYMSDDATVYETNGTPHCNEFVGEYYRDGGKAYYAEVYRIFGYQKES